MAIHIITLCNNPKWIDNILGNITNNPSYLHWHIYVNNCSPEVVEQFHDKLDAKAQVSYLGNGKSFSYMRAEAFLDTAKYVGRFNHWFMNIDADDIVVFNDNIETILSNSTADVVIQDSYILQYPDKKQVVKVNVPKTLTEYCGSTEFLYTVQFIYNLNILREVYVPSDTNVSIWDEVIPQLRLYKANPKIEVASNLFTYYYKRGHETISNNSKYYTLMLNLLEVYRKAMQILDDPVRKELITNRFKTMNLNYILRKAGSEADNIKMLFDKITTEVGK